MRRGRLGALLLVGVVALAVAEGADAQVYYASLGPSGGVGGQRFNDFKFLNETRGRLIEVRVRHGAFIDSVQTVYQKPDGSKVTSPRHGGGGGRLDVLRLASDEFIVRIEGKHGNVVDSLEIWTNKKRKARFGGPGGAVDYSYTAIRGSRIQGFKGRAGKFLDAIGVVLETRTR